MPSCAQWSPLGMEGKMRVLILALRGEPDEGGMITSRGAECFWSVAEDIPGANVRLNRNCLLVCRSSPRDITSTTTNNNDVAGMIAMAGGAMLYRLLLRQERRGDALVVTRLLGSGFNRRSCGDNTLPNEEQLTDLISAHLLALCANSGGSSVVSSISLRSPEWFLFVFGNSRLLVTDDAVNVPQQLHQPEEQRAVVLWFHNEMSPVECNSSAPESTALLCEWWRSLQRSLLLPVAEIAVDLLLSCHQKPCDDVGDMSFFAEEGSAIVDEETNQQKFDWKHELSHVTASGRWLTLHHGTDSDVDKGKKRDSARQSLGCSAGVDDLSLLQESKLKMDLRSSSVLQSPAFLSSSLNETEEDERGLPNLCEAQHGDYQKMTEALVPQQLQLKAILENTPHIILFVVADDTAVGGSSLPPNAAGLSTALATPKMWYVQLVLQYEETCGVLTSLLGSTPKVRLTPSAYSASRFVLLPDEEKTGLREGWMLHSVDHPGVVLQAVVDCSGVWSIVPVTLTEILPLFPLRRPASGADRKNKEDTCAPDISASRCQSEIRATSRFYVDYGQPEPAPRPYSTLHVIPFFGEAVKLKIMADLNLHTLTAVPTMMQHTTSKLTVYSTVAPAWRERTVPRLFSPFSHLQGSIARLWRHCFPLLPLEEANAKNVFFDTTNFSDQSGSLGCLKPQGLLQKKAESAESISAVARAICCYPLLSAVTVSLSREPLRVVFVGSSAVGKTMIVRWLWARSHGWSDEETLHELDKWFCPAPDTLAEEEGDKDVVTTLLQTPALGSAQQLQRLLSVLLPTKEEEDKMASDGQNAGKHVVLTVGGQTHTFFDADARFLMQSVAGVSEVVLHVVDSGISVRVQIIDIPGLASRELLRTHCADADVVMCAIDVCDYFSLAWLEERLDVLISASTKKSYTQEPLPSLFPRGDSQPHQQFVLLKVSEGSPHQVVYSREVRRVLQKADMILSTHCASWEVWEVPCKEKMENSRRCELLYQKFVDLVQRRHASRLVSATMGWSNNIVWRLQRVARLIESAYDDADPRLDHAACHAEEAFPQTPDCGMLFFPILLRERILMESSQYVIVGPPERSLPLWWRLLRWLMTGFCISDPLALCFWLALQVGEEGDDDIHNGNRIGVGKGCHTRSDDHNHLHHSLVGRVRSVAVSRLQQLLEDFYRFRMQSKPATENIFTSSALVVRDVAQLLYVDVSLPTLKSWLSCVADTMLKVSNDDDVEGGAAGGCQMFLVFMLSQITGDTLLQSVGEARRKREDASLTEVFLMSVTMLRLLHDSSAVRDAICCDLEPFSALPFSRLACSMGSGPQLNEGLDVEVIRTEEKIHGVPNASYRCDDQINHATHFPMLSKDTGEGSGETMDCVRNTGLCFSSEVPVAEFVRSLRPVWPSADVAYVLDWRITWTERDEAQFIRNAHLEIERHEKKKRCSRKEAYAEEALGRLAPSIHAYVDRRSSSTAESAGLKVTYRKSGEDLAPLSP